MDQNKVDMDQNAELGRIEERRSALEFGRLKLDRQKASIEFLLKRRELKASNNKGWKEFFLSNPLPLAIVGGFITVMATTITGHFSASDNLAAEVAKTREALQADLIKKFVDSPNPKTVRANLQFLVDVGLVPTYADNLRSFLAKNKDNDAALPSSFALGPTPLSNIHTDDDAINLVMRFEGGFSADPLNPDAATNFGIMTKDLSHYLGRSASLDDLRNVSPETAREIYKKEYLAGPVSDIVSVQVKAAYLGLASFMGTRQANKLFQAALGKIDKLPASDDEVVGPGTVQRINAIDPNLLVETVNCEAAKYYQSLPTFHLFSRAWMIRLRAFSPAPLKGICPELQNASTSDTTPTPKQ
jgi:lysozyme family protein